MVLGNATSDALVDHFRSRVQRTGPMPHNQSIQPLLQRPRRIHQRPVLAPPIHLLLLRSPLPRPDIPPLLPPAILSLTGRELRSLTSALLVPPQLRSYLSPWPRPLLLNRIPRNRTFLRSRLHLESSESRDHAQFSGITSVQGAVVTVGVDGVQFCSARDCAQG